MTLHVTIPEPIAQRIRDRKPFKDEHDTQGYLTRGGTYVIATQGKASDSGKPRDLLAVVPDERFRQQVVVLWPAVRPDFVTQVEKALRA